MSIGGHASALAVGERALGHASAVMAHEPSPYGYPVDYTINPDRRTGLGSWSRRLRTFFKHRTSWDVYHFNFGASLFHSLDRGYIHWDLPFYGSKSRRIMTFQGCDARQKYPTLERLRRTEQSAGACYFDGCYGGMCNSGIRDKYRRQGIEKAEKHVDHMFALNPDLLDFLPPEKSSFLPYAVSVPANISTVDMPRGLPLRIAHLPTDRIAKGTDIICKAVDAVNDWRPGAIALDLVEKVDNRAALQRIAQAHVVIDQVLLGWYGALAVEAMMLGRPVIAFIDPYQKSKAPADLVDQLPVIEGHPQVLVRTLKSIVGNLDSLSEISDRSRGFARTWHVPRTVAEIAVAAYNADTA